MASGVSQPVATASPESTPPTTSRIGLAWLVRLRWGAVAGQLGTLAVAGGPLGLELPLAGLTSLILGTLLSNLFAFAWLRLGRPVAGSAVGALLALDVAILTGLLFLTGGPSNPFGVLYLVHVALAAVMLPAAWSWFLGGLSLLGYGLLFRWSVPLGGMAHHHGGDAFSLHLQGMWAAFAVAAALIAWFVTRLTASLRQREAELASIRERAARYEKLAAVGTLAAGAAHELSTPLGTIAVVARELERAASDDALRYDARLVRAEVDRCQAILRGMRSTVPGGEELLPLPLGQVVAELGFDRLEVRLDPQVAELPVAGPAVDRILRNLVQNALDASPAGALVQLVATAEGESLRIAVIDRGCGMTPEVRARAGEPFYTTKAPGRGMGLGLHLVRTTVEGLGGSFRIDSREGEGEGEGEGITATVRLPLVRVPHREEAA